MAKAKMHVELLAYTQLANDFATKINLFLEETRLPAFTDGQAVALTAIRTCYSPNKPSEIIFKEGEKYFGRKATDGKGGTETDRLIRHIVSSKHTSTLEHLAFTFAIENVSRACMAQLTRHRAGYGYSVQSQRFVKYDKNGNLFYIWPDSIESNENKVYYRGKERTPREIYEMFLNSIKETYVALRKAGVPAEDARMVLPTSTATNIVMTANLRALLDFYSKRRKGRGAQWEIAQLAEKLKEAVVNVEPWTESFFN